MLQLMQQQSYDDRDGGLSSQQVQQGRVLQRIQQQLYDDRGGGLSSQQVQQGRVLQRIDRDGVLPQLLVRPLQQQRERPLRLIPEKPCADRHGGLPFYLVRPERPLHLVRQQPCGDSDGGLSSQQAPRPKQGPSPQ